MSVRLISGADVRTRAKDPLRPINHDTGYALAELRR